MTQNDPVAVIGSQWQSNFYRSIITTGLSTAGAKTNSALPTILSWPFLESLEFQEILRLFKFEDIITLVRRSVGSATPLSVMVLFSFTSVFL